MFRSAYKPGDRVPDTGVYWVYHYAHRISHTAQLQAGDSFPFCHQCGERVRFEPVSEGSDSKAQPINHYADFRRAA